MKLLKVRWQELNFFKLVESQIQNFKASEFLNLVVQGFNSTLLKVEGLEESGEVLFVTNFLLVANFSYDGTQFNGFIAVICEGRLVGVKLIIIEFGSVNHELDSGELVFKRVLGACLADIGDSDVFLDEKEEVVGEGSETSHLAVNGVLEGLNLHILKLFIFNHFFLPLTGAFVGSGTTSYSSTTGFGGSTQFSFTIVAQLIGNPRTIS